MQIVFAGVAGEQPAQGAPQKPIPALIRILFRTRFDLVAFDMVVTDDRDHFLRRWRGTGRGLNRQCQQDQREDQHGLQI